MRHRAGTYKLVLHESSRRLPLNNMTQLTPNIDPKSLCPSRKAQSPSPKNITHRPPHPMITKVHPPNPSVPTPTPTPTPTLPNPTRRPPQALPSLLPSPTADHPSIHPHIHTYLHKTTPTTPPDANPHQPIPQTQHPISPRPRPHPSPTALGITSLTGVPVQGIRGGRAARQRRRRRGPTMQMQAEPLKPEGRSV